ncbi:hypothetical protein [Deinococcus pimensis]|uniref:hypothetical protein n=1 Tax=Deinococcus pimensis TaxID=309888 RepID=UPI0012FBC21D|nr:hypothetical protein [Deinococcus pimensis]
MKQRISIPTGLILSLLVMGCGSTSHPVDVTGYWVGNRLGPTQPMTYRLFVEQSGTSITGELEIPLDPTDPLSPWDYVGDLNGEVRGAGVVFTVLGVRENAGKRIEFSGEVNGGQLAGRFVSEVESKVPSGPALAWQKAQ